MTGCDDSGDPGGNQAMTVYSVPALPASLRAPAAVYFGSPSYRLFHRTSDQKAIEKPSGHSQSTERKIRAFPARERAVARVWSGQTFPHFHPRCRKGGTCRIRQVIPLHRQPRGVLRGTAPKPVFGYFCLVTKVPRRRHNTKQYCGLWGKNCSLVRKGKDIQGFRPRATYFCP